MNTALRAALQESGVIVRESVSLAPLTHVRIGGPAEFFVEPLNIEGVSQVVRACRELDVPLRVLGGGSNLLVADEGVPGVVMTLGRLDRLVRDGVQLAAGAGVSLPTLLRSTREVGLAGLEVLCGVPAVVGGAVAMNAGTRDGATFDSLVAITVADRDGEIRQLEKPDLHPKYRDGGIGDHLVLEAVFELEEDDPKAIYARFEESLRRRNATQPVTQRSVGCVFRNPDGESAGQLIERANCKLLRRGGVSVSAKHANYFINEGDGTCADFTALMGDVIARVQEAFSVELQPEVRRWFR